MITFHDPEPQPSSWMVEGLGATTPPLGVQVRVRVTDDGLHVGMFTNDLDVTSSDIQLLLTTLAAWRRPTQVELPAPSWLTLGLWGQEAPAWGPGFTYDPDLPTASTAELVAAAIAYLQAR